MKNLNNIKLIAFAFCALLFCACDLEEGADLNGPAVDAILADASRGDISSLAQGIQSDMRERLVTYLDDCGVIGREYFRFSSSDPRLTTDLLGGGSSVLDNNTFYLTGPWLQRYATIKSANILMQAAANSTAANFTAQELSAINGFAKTIQAYELLLNLNLTNSGGIRVDVSDKDNLGPFLDKPASLSAIKGLLDNGRTDLTAAGTAFPFNLSAGFSGFNTPNTFMQVNRAIAARVALYQGDKVAAIASLGDSFFSIGGDLDTGAYYVFSNIGVDIPNEAFFALNSSTAGARIMQPNFLTDADLGDNRLSKVVLRNEALTLDGLTGSYDVWVFTSNSAPIPIIRNEELMLIYAEANIGIDVNKSLMAINMIRNAAGLANYVGATNDASLLNEVLKQRRYSLYAEGHRWIDMRRTGKLSELPIDRPEDDVWVEFPIPQDEGQ